MPYCTTSPKKIQYACVVSGNLSILFILIALAASGFLPPTRPSWDAQQTVTHYLHHEDGIRAGAALIILSGMLYLPLTAAISAQMRRVPELHYAVGGFSILLAGLVLATAAYRLDRHAEITQALNDLSWISLLSAWPLFMAQSFALAYAIAIDSRPKPPFPKAVALVNVMVPITYIPSIALHCIKTGPVAWDGAVGFWIPVILFWRPGFHRLYVPLAGCVQRNGPVIRWALLKTVPGWAAVVSYFFQAWREGLGGIYKQCAV